MNSKIDMTPDLGVVFKFISEVKRNDEKINSTLDLTERKAIPLPIAIERAKDPYNLIGKKVRFSKDYNASSGCRSYSKGVTGKIDNLWCGNDDGIITDITIDIKGYKASWLEIEYFEVIK